ncbi:SYP6 [Auxenochlorella protothecoides x Auxenochlorella symbiontica]
MAGQQDPYFIVQRDVNDTLSSVQTRYTQLRSLPAAHSNRKPLLEELQEDCSSLEYMVSEIERSLDAAEANPARFRLSQAELSDRRRWVISARRQTSVLNEGLAAARTAADAAPRLTPASKLAAAVHEENDRFIASEADRQQALMARQDEDLDVLGGHVVRIGELGREMGQELHMQGQLLEEFDEELEGTSTRLAAAQKKIQAVLDRTGSKGQLAIIGFLLVVLVLLVVLAIA